MEINYWAIFLCAIVAMILGAIWFGPLFGRIWIRVVGANPNDLVARKKMQQRAGPLYLVQFLLSLFQIWVLVFFIRGWGVHTIGMPPTFFENSIWIWAAFVVPTLAGTCMWNNESAKVSWTRFGLQAGYQLLNFMAFGWILGLWR